MPTRHIHLNEHDDRFVEQQISTGRYPNVSEVFRAGLRLLESQSNHEAQQQALLQKLAAEGFRELDQGCGLDAADEADLRRTISEIGHRAASNLKHRPAD